MNEAKILVVFYSSSGNTRKVAQALADALDADLEEIEPVDRVEVNIRGKGMRNFGNMGRVVLGGKLQRSIALKPRVHDPADYSLVVVGTPVYANTLPPAPRSYLSGNRGRLHTVAFFCTGEDPNNAHIFELMAEAAGKPPLLAHPFHAPRVIEGDFTADVETYAAQLRAAQLRAAQLRTAGPEMVDPPEVGSPAE